MMPHDRPLGRRAFLSLLAAGGATVALGSRALAAPAPRAITVYKSPSCGCCKQWVAHLRANHFQVTVKDVDDVSPMKSSMGVPKALQSCHTGVIGGYAIEGHVPASDIVKLLAERPRIAGLAVPGMPVGSPGMEQGGAKDRFDVVAFDARGKTKVFASH